MLLSNAFFGQQAWSALAMMVPTDLFDRRIVAPVRDKSDSTERWVAPLKAVNIVITSAFDGALPVTMRSIATDIRRFGPFELDLDAGEVRRDGRRVKLQPQPFRLLVLLTGRPGSLISREEIRNQLWPDGTFVDFDQSVNFAVKQIRDAMGDSATRPLYVETVPRQGYRFVAPVKTILPPDPAAEPTTGTTVRLHKAMWANIAELQMAEARHRRLLRVTVAGLALVLAVMILYGILR